MEAFDMHLGRALSRIRRASRFQRIALLIVLGAFAPGCTSHRLQINTVNQARTVGDLQYQQALDNMAMFCLNPEALPSLVSLKTGASQVGDTGTLGFLGAVGLATGVAHTSNFTFGSSPTISGTRVIVDQWGSTPITDDNNLLLVRKAFRSALGYHDLIEEDEANDLAHDLSPQIGTTADISIDHDTFKELYNEKFVSRALTIYNPAVAAGGTAGVLTYKHALDRVSDLLEQNITSTLDPEILRRSYGFTSNLPLELLFEGPNLHPVPPSTYDDIKSDLKNTIGLKQFINIIDVNIYDNHGLDRHFPIAQSDPRYGAFEQAFIKLNKNEDVDGDKRRELIEVVVDMQGLKDSLKRPFVSVQYSATGQAKEVINRLNDAQDALDKIHPGWFHCGSKKPKDACYVGHATFCGQECYVWVCRDGLDQLAEFTRTVLKLGSTFRDIQILNAPSGIQFSPAFR
jgi:hypothetical protein